MESGNPAAPPAYTVCICTLNRVKYLGATIEAVLKQDLPRGRFEILVVDNGSTDGTSEMVSVRFGADTRVPVRCIREETPGLSRARNRAIAETTSEFLVFLDDDAIPEPGWLALLADVFASSGKIGVVGGGVVPVYEGGEPPWFSNRVNCIFMPLAGIEKRSEAHYPRYPYGVNLAFRRTVFEKVGLFREDLGYKGTRLIPSEEVEIMLRIERGGGTIVYEPHALVRHVIPAARLVRKRLRQREYSYGLSLYELEKVRRADFEPWGYRQILQAWWNALRGIQRAWIWEFAGRAGVNGLAFDAVLDAAVSCGRAWALFHEANRQMLVRMKRKA